MQDLNTSSIYLSQRMKAENPFKKITLQRLQQEVDNFAKLKKHSLEQRPSSVQERSKKVVSKCFHGAGIVVPVHNDVGYRPIPETNGKLNLRNSQLSHYSFIFSWMHCYLFG